MSSRSAGAPPAEIETLDAFDGPVNRYQRA
jgi:hypothetical protein